jgi:hypothetical protein
MCGQIFKTKTTDNIHTYIHTDKQKKESGKESEKERSSILQQCDEIGRNFDNWAKFFGVGSIFSENYGAHNSPE